MMMMTGSETSDLEEKEMEKEEEEEEEEYDPLHPLPEYEDDGPDATEPRDRVQSKSCLPTSCFTSIVIMPCHVLMLP